MHGNAAGRNRSAEYGGESAVRVRDLYNNLKRDGHECGPTPASQPAKACPARRPVWERRRPRLTRPPCAEQVAAPVEAGSSSARTTTSGAPSSCR